MKQLNNLMIYFCYLIILIFILIMIKEYPSLNKNDLIKSLSNQ
jgi:hypothetical protein